MHSRGTPSLPQQLSDAWSGSSLLTVTREQSTDKLSRERSQVADADACYPEPNRLCRQTPPRAFQYETVVDDCTAALELDPRYVKALLRRQQANERLEKYDLALEGR